jgi:hypothetical protein
VWFRILPVAPRDTVDPEAPLGLVAGEPAVAAARREVAVRGEIAG